MSDQPPIVFTTRPTIDLIDLTEPIVFQARIGPIEREQCGERRFAKIEMAVHGPFDSDRITRNKLSGQLVTVTISPVASAKTDNPITEINAIMNGDEVKEIGIVRKKDPVSLSGKLNSMIEDVIRFADSSGLSLGIYDDRPEERFVIRSARDFTILTKNVSLEASCDHLQRSTPVDKNGERTGPDVCAKCGRDPEGD